MIDLGDTYSVAYNDHRRELFVCGFWVTGKIDEQNWWSRSRSNQGLSIWFRDTRHCLPSPPAFFIM